MNHRFLWRCLLTGSVLALSLGLPMVDSPLTLPTAYAHHGGGGGGGGGGGSSGGSGGGGGGGKSSTVRQVPEEGYGKGGRGSQGMRP